MGFNGRQCVLRALCESKQSFNNKEPNMVEKLLSTVFRYLRFVEKIIKEKINSNKLNFQSA